ncbi:MAG: DUF4421 domain-containing protein [Muribaculaceae bacterium]|nr:DUF4421 domain-containing protein [Muribaculaceae bacterium]
MKYRLLILLLSLISLHNTAFSFNVNLDSIATKGKFMKFYVDTYRFTDKFFNEIDTAYVSPTGYKWNVKLRAISWTDFNGFYFDNSHQLGMASPFCSSIGADVQFMAIALGYDINMNKLFGGKDRSKSRFNFEFSSARFSGRFYSLKNNDGMDLKSINKKPIEKILFPGITSSTWGIDLTYYFNYKRYSNQAAFSFGKIQKRSQGSFITGLIFQSQKLFFDMNKLPGDIKEWLPENWQNRDFKSDGKNIGISGGYGQNWVPHKNITLGFMGLVIPSLHYGYLNSIEKGYSFRLNYRFSASAVWNHNRWFVGAVAKADAGFIYSESTLTNGQLSLEAKFGWRF